MHLPIARWSAHFLSLVVIVTTSATAMALTADQVILKNGDRITGRVLTMGADTVLLETDAEGTISIRRSAIERVVRQSAATALGVTAPNAPTAGAVPQMQPNPVASSDPAMHCLKQLKQVPMSWSFQLQGGPNQVVVGTVSQNLFGAGLNVSSCEGSRRNQTSLAAAGSHSRFYEHHSGSITADVADAELEQQHFFGSPQGTAIFAVGDVFNNNALGMAMQKSVGVGLLSPQFRYKATAYDFAGDVRYLDQHLDGVSPTLNLVGVRLKEQMHLQGKLFHLDEQGWVMPMLNDVHALQAYASIEPSVTIKPWLTLGISEEESYLENAPYPRQKNYFASALTLTLQGGSGSRSK